MRTLHDAVVLGKRKKPGASLADDLAVANLRLREDNVHLKNKIRRFLENRERSTHSSIPFAQECDQPTPTSIAETISRPMRGHEETNPSRAQPAVPAQLAPPVGLQHMLVFLSIVLRICGTMPKLLMDRLLESMPPKEETSERWCSAGGETTRFDRIVLSWQNLLSQHTMKPADIAVLSRVLQTMECLPA